MHKIGLITIGQSPREDIISVMRGYLTQEVEILQRGALDGLDLAMVEELQPESGQPTLVTRMRDGTEVQVTREKVLPLMQRGIDALVQEGVEFIVLLCTGEFPELRADRMILYPGKLFHSVITALADRAKLGIIVPSPGQILSAKGRWGGLNVVVAAASPYLAAEVSAREWERAAKELQERRVDLVYLDCMGMNEEMKRIVQRVTRKPVVLASSLVARIIDELIGCRISQ